MRSIILFALVSLAFCSLLVFADDTYNFYFQKAPGPVTVNQGSASQTVSPTAAPPQQTPEAAATTAAQPATPAAPAATTPATIARPEERANEYKPWYVNVGGTKWFVGTGINYEGLNVQVGHRFNRYLAAEGEVAYAKARPEFYDPNYMDYPSTMGIFSAGMLLTPVTVQLFGWNLLEFSGMAGVSYVTEVKEISPYVGLEMTLTLNPNFAISSYGKWFTRKEERGVQLSDDYGGYRYVTNVMPESSLGIEVSMRF